ncbi:FG-GAP repeat protein [Streptomyces sp. NPDC059900]|uniref:FG-GAP repeat protein n=1 Tax=Streptomyces sp. NPDC059900 TaxID=3155816 RepID=UPI0034464285
MFGALSGTGEVNGDGHPDLVISTPGGDEAGRFRLLPGELDGSGPAPSGATACDATAYGRTSISATLPPLDINGDTYADVVAETPGGLLLFPEGKRRSPPATRNSPRWRKRGRTRRTDAEEPSPPRIEAILLVKAVPRKFSGPLQLRAYPSATARPRSPGRGRRPGSGPRGSPGPGPG